MTTTRAWQNTARKYMPAFLVLVIAGGWILPSLGNGMLWQDEAQTALLARTTLKHGVPIAFDGQNSISQEGGDDYGPHGLWKWHMWLPFYVLAAFFKLFHESTTIARLPFALFGVATVVLSYQTAKLLFDDTKTAVLTLILLLACIPFVVLVRQCRYYSPAMFFSLLMLHAYLKMTRGSAKSWIVLLIAGVLLFNSHFLYCFTAWISIALHAWIWHKSQLKRLVLTAAMTGVVCLPSTLWLASLNYHNYAHGVFNATFTTFQFLHYVTLFFEYILPWPIVLLVAICVGLRLIRRQKRDSNTRFWEQNALPLLFCIFTIVICSPFTPGPAFRYLGPLIAPLIILLARWIVLVFKTNVIVGVAAACVLAWWWPVSSYLFELTHRFEGPLEGIVSLLNTRGLPGDIVVTPYEDLPLKFYTHLRIVGGLTGEDLTPAMHARWLILRRHRILDREIPIEDFIRQQILTDKNYDRLSLNVPDTPYENREDPQSHLFQTAINEQRVTVCERHGS